MSTVPNPGEDNTEGNGRGFVGWRKFIAMVCGMLAVVVPAAILSDPDPAIYDTMADTIWKVSGVYMLGNGVSAVANAFSRR